MNLKRVFGTILTLLGIIGILYGAWSLVSIGTENWLNAVVSFGVGLIFFFSGIGLLKGTKDES